MWVDVKSQAWKLTSLTRRPWPSGAEDIGTWHTVMEVIMTIAVITNGALIVFTMNLLPDDPFSYSNQFWTFIAFQWGVLTIQTVIRSFVPAIPYEVDLQLKRQKNINKSIIFREVAESLEDVMASVSLMSAEPNQEQQSTLQGWSNRSVDALNINCMVRETINEPIIIHT